MRYLFLDIDGVLNHENWYHRGILKYRNTFTTWWESCFDPECVERVKTILKETGARLVVSSSWRRDLNLKEYFSHFGLPTDFDITPTLFEYDDEGLEGWVERGREIEEFLKVHPCDEYVILDDDFDFTEDQLKNHFVHCCGDRVQAIKEGNESETGLSEGKMRMAIRILKK